VLREVVRVLRPGGRFIATVPSDSFRQYLAGYRERIEAGDPEGAEAYATKVDRRLDHYRYFSPAEWEDLLDEFNLQLIRSQYYIPVEVAEVWDRANITYGIQKEGLPLFRWLVSPRLQKLGYQILIKRIIVTRLSVVWRHLYEMDVTPNTRGAGLLIVADKVRS
jgi:SAM-dependent methyltransferase